MSNTTSATDALRDLFRAHARTHVWLPALLVAVAAGAIALHVRTSCTSRPALVLCRQSSAPLSLTKPCFAGRSRPFALTSGASSWVGSMNLELEASTLSSIEMTVPVACRSGNREVQ
jgi:hypothetical protein